MSDYSKIEYFDLSWESKHGRLPVLIGRTEECDRLSRIVSRSLEHHAIITAPSGTGKSAFILGWANFHNKKAGHTEPIVKLEISSLLGIQPKSPVAQNFYQEAFRKLEHTIVIIDDFAQLYNNQPSTFQHIAAIIKPLVENSDCRLIIVMEPEELSWMEQNQKQFMRSFETITLKPQHSSELTEIVRQSLEKISVSKKIPDDIISETLKLIEKLPQLGNAPASAIKLLDEAAKALPASPFSTHPLLKYFPNSKKLQDSDIQKILHQIISEKTNIPIGKLGQDEREKLKTLLPTLQTRVIGQAPALETLVSVIQRAQLGLRSGSRPLGSFLLLGPSGVGKTETAKLLAEELYGGKQSFLRIDMSEFGQEHTVARLIGSPAGYVGFEEGGQITNHFKKHPYSLLLLDEIEKSHAKVFDIFLQLLDDGRLTSGQGETIDATQAVIIATSNLSVDSILAGYEKGTDIHSNEFLKEQIIPTLLRHFRMEFLNRFDAILVYNPLSVSDLTDIALLEIKKIEERVKEHHITFNITREVLSEKIKGLADPRFGARPVKRFIEDTCETLITKALLK
jgi:ATP-dependent Clp protease ATP-binding subunit ClpA